MASTSSLREAALSHRFLVIKGGGVKMQLRSIFTPPIFQFYSLILLRLVSLSNNFGLSEIRNPTSYIIHPKSKIPTPLAQVNILSLR